MTDDPKRPRPKDPEPDRKSPPPPAKPDRRDDDDRGSRIQEGDGGLAGDPDEEY